MPYQISSKPTTTNNNNLETEDQHEEENNLSESDDDSISKQFNPPLPQPKKSRKTIRKLTDDNIGDIAVSSQIMSPESPTSPFSPKVKPISLDLESMKHKNSNTSSASEITKARVENYMQIVNFMFCLM